ncbi:MAG: hypothetical protein IPK26_07425 [Planctomycetes bacterium]|nr:hypothetical protein [Planctomycetota bacterium]
MRNLQNSRWLSLLAIACAVGVATAQIERLRDQIRQPGPDAREVREAAIEALLALPDERAHELLQQALRVPPADDADRVTPAVLQALSRRLRAAADPVFSAAADPVQRSRLLAGYLPPLIAFWRGQTDATGELMPDPLRDLARACVVRVPAADLDRALRTCAEADRLSTLRCAADAQQLVAGLFLAEHLQDTDSAVAAAAAAGLRQLTFVAEGFADRKAFTDWYEANKDRRYLDLAEAAARAHLRATTVFAAQLGEVQKQALIDFVRLHVEKRTGVDWAAIEARVFGGDPIASAGLEQLRVSLAAAPLADEPGPGRVAFLRILLQRLERASPAEATILEIAGYLCRVDDGEVHAAVQQRLHAALVGEQPALQMAAARGLRRLPTADNRAAVVQFARAARRGGARLRPQLEAALATLVCRTPTWHAPLESEPGHAEWALLLRELLLDDPATGLRDDALALALLPDSRGARSATAFALLLALAKDPAVDREFRTTCLLHLQDWRDDPQCADTWVRELARLLDDASEEIRLFAATALAALPEVAGPQAAWREHVGLAMRERLRVETALVVVRAMAECLVAYSRQPETADQVIGTLNKVLDDLPRPLPAEQVARVEPLLHALTTIAVEPRTAVSQWVSACEMLLRFEKRRSLRHVFTGHGAAGLLGRDSTEEEKQAAQKIARLLVKTAVLKNPKESWTASDELRAEVQDVRSAFAVLSGSAELQAPAMRLLRLEVDLALDKSKDVIALALQCLQAGPDDGNVDAMSPAQKDEVRLMLAAAYLLENKADLAAPVMSERDATALEPRALETMERLGRALLPTDAAAAAVWLERALKVTGDEDPAFRRRFLAWAQAASQADSSAREGVLAAAERRRSLFEAADCPAELREAFAALCGRE